ncbi:MAG: speE 3 [Planctomycetota bacterium]|nr:speE 3 [Planctomycetota bacterium]
MTIVEAHPGRIAYLLFFLSGAAGLIYEVSWSRQIGLVFGQSGHTAAVVLGSYFAGMAIGYLAAARWSARVAPLRGYGAAELLAAGWAAILPTVLDAVESHAPMGLVDHPSLVVRTAVRAAIGFLALLPAAVALGATLPFIAQYLKPDQRSSGRRIATAYALNTLGALVGVVAATAVLLLFVGVRRSSYLAAGISAVCGLVAIALGGRGPRTAIAAEQATAKPPAAGESALWVGIVAMTGFGTLALEVLYMRMFALVFHNSTYTFGIVVALFLLGLALGSVIVSRIRMDPHRLAAWAGLLGAAAVAGSLPLFAWATGFGYFGVGNSFAMYVAGAALLVSAIVLVPVTLLGVVLPASWAAAEKSGFSSGRAVGRLTAANTLAATLGSLSASFLLAPSLGLWTAFGVVAGLFDLAAVILFLHRGARLTALVLGPLVAVAIAFAVQVPREMDTTPPGSDVLRRWEGPYGLVDVVRNRSTGQSTIRQNLHYGLGSTFAAGRELAQGHLPLLLHPDPKDVLFLGLGTGLTAASALSHPEVEQVVAAELNPDVVEASRLYFRDQNRGVLDDPKVEVRVDDARHYLLRTDRKFDVIVSDLFVPWESQTGYLYTVEHYRTARRKLKPGGLFCQWLALYQVGEREFQTIADSLASVFPVTTLWWGQVDPNLSFVALIGSEQEIEVDPDSLGRRLASLRRNPEEAGVYLLESQESFLKHFNGRWSVRDAGRLNTDEHPRVEFLAPISNRDNLILVQSLLRSFDARVLSRLPRTGFRWRTGENPGRGEPKRLGFRKE